MTNFVSLAEAPPFPPTLPPVPATQTPPPKLMAQLLVIVPPVIWKSVLPTR